MSYSLTNFPDYYFGAHGWLYQIGGITLPLLTESVETLIYPNPLLTCDLVPCAMSNKKTPSGWNRISFICLVTTVHALRHNTNNSNVFETGSIIYCTFIQCLNLVAASALNNSEHCYDLAWWQFIPSSGSHLSSCGSLALNEMRCCF